MSTALKVIVSIFGRAPDLAKKYCRVLARYWQNVFKARRRNSLPNWHLGENRDYDCYMRRNLADNGRTYSHRVGPKRSYL